MKCEVYIGIGFEMGKEHSISSFESRYSTTAMEVIPNISTYSRSRSSSPPRWEEPYASGLFPSKFNSDTSMNVEDADATQPFEMFFDIGMESGFIPSISQTGRRPPHLLTPRCWKFEDFVPPSEPAGSSSSSMPTPSGVVHVDHEQGRTIRERSRKARPHVRRPPNAFLLFRRAHQDLAFSLLYSPSSSSSDGVSKPEIGDISKLLGAMWHSLKETNPEEAELWYEKAEREKEEHARLYPEYKYKPRMVGGKGETKERGKPYDTPEPRASRRLRTRSVVASLLA